MFSLWGLGTFIPEQMLACQLLAGARENQNQISSLQLPRGLYIMVLKLFTQLAGCLCAACPRGDGCSSQLHRGRPCYRTSVISQLLLGMKAELSKNHKVALCQDVWSLWLQLLPGPPLPQDRNYLLRISVIPICNKDWHVVGVQ